MTDKLPKGFKPAMLKEDWEAYVEKHGHTPMWPPDHRHKFANTNENRKEEPS